MANNSDLKNHKESTNHTESNPNSEVSPAKKPFTEPELSAAVDVLEATTFFQAATSGATN